MAFDDGEGFQHVAGVVSVDAVELELESTESGGELAEISYVPGDGWAVVTEVAGEGSHVVEVEVRRRAMF